MRRRLCALVLCALPAALISSCARQSMPVQPPPVPPESTGFDWQLSSSAFADGERMPVEHTCSGEDISPPLAWSDPPAGTVELALVCDDPDAPSGDWVHWVVYGVGVQTRELRRGMAVTPIVTEPDGAMQGTNDFQTIGYRGPCPPPGRPHRYLFSLYALDQRLSLEPGATKSELLDAMDGRVIAQTRLVGVYER